MSKAFRVSVVCFCLTCQTWLGELLTERTGRLKVIAGGRDGGFPHAYRDGMPKRCFADSFCLGHGPERAPQPGGPLPGTHHGLRLLPKRRLSGERCR